MFSGYQPNLRFRSSILINSQGLSSGPVPATEDLIALHDDLQDIRSRMKNRAQKAKEDLEVFKSKWELAKEKEKSRDVLERARPKGRVKDPLAKIKREASETPSVDDHLLFAHDPRSRAGSNNFRSKAGLDEKNKKKRKREERKERDRTVDDLEQEILDTGRISPPLERPPKKLKHTNHTSQLTIPPPPPPPVAGPESATFWAVPPPPAPNARPILGLWGEGGLLKSAPGKATDVNDDFTNVKPSGTQSQVGPFWREVDSWTRPVGEEDVAWLRYATDDTELFRVPALGRHYAEVWEDEDQLLAAQHQSLSQFHNDSNSASTNGHLNGLGPPSSSAATLVNASTSNPAPSKPVTSTPDVITQDDLISQEKSLGPLSERVLSALLAVPGQIATKKAEDDGPSTNATSSIVTPVPLSFLDMETRLKLELRACGLLGAEEPPFSESYDDDIASELRRLQAELRQVKRVNDVRKERLCSIACDRLAYQDYLEMLDDLNRQISGGYQRIVKANNKASAIGKKKRGPGQLQNEAANEANKAKNLVMDVPEALLKVIEVRRQFKEVFGTAMHEWEARQPGRIIGFPKESVFAGLKIPSDSEWEESATPEEETIA